MFLIFNEHLSLTLFFVFLSRLLLLEFLLNVLEVLLELEGLRLPVRHLLREARRLK